MEQAISQVVVAMQREQGWILTRLGTTYFTDVFTDVNQEEKNVHE